MEEVWQKLSEPGDLDRLAGHRQPGVLANEEHLSLWRLLVLSWLIC